MANEKKKKSYRKEYLNDFRPDESGKYSYQGKMKTFSGTETAARSLAGRTGASAIFFILAAGVVTGRDIGGTAYVLIPYLVALGAVGFALYNIISLGRKTEVREYAAKRAIPRILGGASIALFAAVLSAAGALVTIITAPGTELFLKICFTFLMGGTAVDAFFMRKAAGELSKALKA